MKDETVYVVRCEACFTQLGKVNLIRFENSFPITMIGSLINLGTAQIKDLKHNLYICKDHYDMIYPIVDYNLELPKN